MKGFMKWLGRILGSAATMILIIVLLPYASRVAQAVLPDLSGAHIKSAAILSQQLEQSARLETLQVTGEGVMTAEREALLIGTVSSVSVSYHYSGSYGVDLSRVQLKVEGSKLVFLLPQPEVLIDDITMDEVYRDGILDGAVRIGDKELQALLDEEKEKFREQYLRGENAPALREASEKAFLDTIAVWLSQTNSRFQYEFQWATE